MTLKHIQKKKKEKGLEDVQEIQLVRKAEHVKKKK